MKRQHVLTFQIRRARDFIKTDFLPLEVAGNTLGWLRPAFAEQLRRWPAYFQVQQQRVIFSNTLNDTQSRTEALAECTRTLAREEVITGWRNETYAISSPANGAPLFHIERAAMRHFGLLAHGANLNAYTGKDEQMRLWIARRSISKSIDPGLLDTAVGGGIASEHDAWSTLIKECGEEAGIPAGMCKHARFVGKIFSIHGTREGLHREFLHVYDLVLPESFTPLNEDGEVSEFHLLEASALLPLLEKSAFSIEAGLITLDFLFRHALIPHDHPDFDFLSQSLAHKDCENGTPTDSL